MCVCVCLGVQLVTVCQHCGHASPQQAVLRGQVQVQPALQQQQPRMVPQHDVDVLERCHHPQQADPTDHAEQQLSNQAGSRQQPQQQQQLQQQVQQQAQQVQQRVEELMHKRKQLQAPVTQLQKPCDVLPSVQPEDQMLQQLEPLPLSQKPGQQIQRSQHQVHQQLDSTNQRTHEQELHEPSRKLQPSSLREHSVQLPGEPQKQQREQQRQQPPGQQKRHKSEAVPKKDPPSAPSPAPAPSSPPASPPVPAPVAHDAAPMSPAEAQSRAKDRVRTNAAKTQNQRPARPRNSGPAASSASKRHKVAELLDMEETPYSQPLSRVKAGPRSASQPPVRCDAPPAAARSSSSRPARQQGHPQTSHSYPQGRPTAAKLPQPRGAARRQDLAAAAATRASALASPRRSWGRSRGCCVLGSLGQC